MVTLSIDNQPVSVPEGTTILDAALSVGVEIPTLCYLKDINDIGACRVCVVEIRDYDRLVAACNTPVDDGIAVFTNSPRVRRTRKVNVELILSRHDCQCVVCVRSGNCALQELANDLYISRRSYKHETLADDWDGTFPLQRDSGKCIQCMRCIQVCDNIQDLHVWDLVNFGSHISVDVGNNQLIHESACSLCGQCITHCPVGALRARIDTDRVMEALANPDVVTVVQVAPAVRSAWAEDLGLPREEATPGRMAAALKRMGFDYVFDTDFGADLTIMEEGMEFMERVVNAREKPEFPMFTSCCPGWVRFFKSQYPDMVCCLSSAKSPQQMFGAMAKTYFAERVKIDPARIFVLSIMPCVAKKHECALPGMNAAGTGRDVDAVITTREFSRLIKAEHLNPALLPEAEFDSPLGEGSGAGVIFGATGGVMEAALRTVYCVINGKKPPETDFFQELRSPGGWRSAEFDMSGRLVRVAVASGLANARKLVEAVRRGAAKYDFVEIMACPGGCAGGGGQPIARGVELAVERGRDLFMLDAESAIRYSHENPSINRLYKEFLDRPLSPRAHELLHLDHSEWKMPHR
ncbi:MAG: [FeFe] hydrogenase, group A [Planctomycetota bacterium]|jgi:NADH-quinone oxidoreductase subunit G|nr:[FeFe] hydrogenase, group A [Planctomycetota bacterium]